MTSQSDLQEIGRALASAMLKGNEEQKPTTKVPLIQLCYVCRDHDLAALSASDFRRIAKAMQETLEEADRWTSTA